MSRSPKRTPGAGRRSLLRFAALVPVVAIVLGVAFLTPAALAESPVAVAEELSDDGVFVGFGRGDIDEDALVAAVEDARFGGLRLVAVAPRDPQPNAAAFARRIQEQTEADAAIIFPPEGVLETYVIEDLSTSRIRATEAAREFADPARAVQAFATEIGSTRDTGTPEIVSQILRALVLLALVIGIIVIIEQGVAKLRKPTDSVK